MRIAVGISGASGTVYGQRLVQVLVEAGIDVVVTLSPTIAKLAPAELDRDEDHRPRLVLAAEREQQLIALMAQLLVAVVQKPKGEDHDE